MFEYRIRRAQDLSRDVVEQTSWPGALRVAVAGSFGDVAMGLAVLCELPADRAANLHLFIEARYADFCRIFPLRARLVTLVDEPAMNIIKQCFDPARFGEAGHMTVLLATLYPLLPELLHAGQVDQMQALRRIMSLPDRAGVLPLTPDDQALALTQQLLDRAGVQRGLTLVISPFNNTQMEIPLATWLRLADLVLARGLQVVFNIARPHLRERRTVPPGYATVELPPQCAVEFIDEAGYHMGGINGLVSILAILRKRARVMAVIHCNADQQVHCIGGERMSAQTASHLRWFRHDMVDPSGWHEFVLSDESQFDALAQALLGMLGLNAGHAG